MSTYNEIKHSLLALSPADYVRVISDVDSTRSRTVKESAEPPKGSSRDEFARWIAGQHLSSDPGVCEVLYLPHGPENEIRLIEVNQLMRLPTWANDKIEPLDFGLDIDGVDLTLLVADVTPEQAARIHAGTLPLPDGWSLAGSHRFERSKS